MKKIFLPLILLFGASFQTQALDVEPMNNKYSQTTSSRETFFGNIKKRIEGFGIKFSETNV